MRQDAIINRQAEVVIVICINHIREVAVVHPRQAAVHHIAVNHHQAVLLRAVQAVPVQAAVATMVNGMLPKAVEVFTGCKVGDVIEMMGKEWRIEDVTF